MRKLDLTNINDIFYVLFMFSIVIWMLAAWLTHIIVCINSKEWLFLIAGAIMAPIAWIHGTGVWLGVW